MDAEVAYLALAAALAGAMLAVRLSGSGIVILHERRVTGPFGLAYRVYLALGAVSVALAVLILVIAYWWLDWRLVLAFHLGFTILPFWIGGWLWRIWGACALKPLLAEVGVFHVLSLAGSVAFLAGALS